MGNSSYSEPAAGAGLTKSTYPKGMVSEISNLGRNQGNPGTRSFMDMVRLPVVGELKAEISCYWTAGGDKNECVRLNS